MIKYRTGQYSGGLITQVEVERETIHFVYFNGGKSAKRSDYTNYFDTWEEAKNHLLKEAELQVESYRSSLARANEYLSKVMALSNAEAANESVSDQVC